MHRYILVQVKHNYFVVLQLTDIYFIEADGHYARCITSTTTYLITRPLKQLEAELPADLFCRVHRTYIIQFPLIISINDNLIHLENKDIPLSEKYRKDLFERMELFK
jgi:DNA-binding LytR/AlgR family response regulator